METIPGQLGGGWDLRACGGAGGRSELAVAVVVAAAAEATEENGTMT